MTLILQSDGQTAFWGLLNGKVYLEAKHNEVVWAWKEFLDSLPDAERGTIEQARDFLVARGYSEFSGTAHPGFHLDEKLPIVPDVPPAALAETQPVETSAGTEIPIGQGVNSDAIPEVEDGNADTSVPTA